jgi:hypothetical protein
MLLPAIAAGKLGSENKGFALGLAPGIMYRDKERRKNRDGSPMSAQSMEEEQTMKKGGKVKKMASGGYVKAADGVAKKGKTKGRMC